MKKIGQAATAVLMFVGALFFGIGIFCSEALKKENLSQAIAKLDMVAVVKSEIGEQYELIGQLLDTEEFKDILGTYTDGFINYMIDGYGSVSVSQEQMRELFDNYSSILLEQYPELAFLPTDKFVDFLTESVNIEKILPSYESLMAHVPSQALTTLKILKSPWLTAGSLGVFLLSVIVYLAMDVKRALQIIGTVLLAVGGIWLALSESDKQIFSLASMKPYVMLRPVAADLLSRFQPLAAVYAGTGTFLAGLGLTLKRKGVKHG